MRHAIAWFGAVAAIFVTAAPLQAAEHSGELCADARGVNIVVEGHGILALDCDLQGGDVKAARVFDHVGIRLTYAAQAPGFVCRINDLPKSDPCRRASPDNAYWALWWADGHGGDWTYAKVGVTGLAVSDGAYLAWVWQSQRTPQEPSVTPAQRPQPQDGTAAPARKRPKAAVPESDVPWLPIAALIILAGSGVWIGRRRRRG